MVILVLIAAMLFLLMGLAGLLKPATILKPFGTDVGTVDGRNEVRAVYGGYGVAMAAALILAIAAPALQGGILVCVALAMAGMAAGRVISAAIDRRAGFYPWLFLGVEAVVAVMLIVAYLRGV